jgi:hypothetical protein
MTVPEHPAVAGVRQLVNRAERLEKEVDLLRRELNHAERILDAALTELSWVSGHENLFGDIGSFLARQMDRRGDPGPDYKPPPPD